MIVSIIIFFAIMFGLGFSILYLFKIKQENNIEKYFLYLAVGLGTFPLLAVTLNLIQVPLHWLSFLVLALIIPAVSIFREKIEFPKGKLTKTNIYAGIVVFIALIFFIVYIKGAFGYNYLEDDDSWGHAMTAKYVAEYRTYSLEYNPETFKRTYLEPYPPAYDVLMGVMHQTNYSLSSTLKFFNVLVVTLGLLFFYLFASEFFSNKAKGLAATFIAAILPSFMSHFIWSQTLALVLFFPAFYAVIKAKNSKAWLYVSFIMIGSILVAQPSSAAIFGILLGLYWISSVIIESVRKKKPAIWGENRHFIIAGIGGVVASMIYWIPTLIKYGWENTLEGIGLFTGLFSTEAETLAADTSGGLVYGIRDFFFAPLVSKMDQPTGWGVFVFLLVAFALVMLVLNYKRWKAYSLTMIVWFIFTLLGTEGNAMPVKLFPHRFWAFLAIPAALLCAEGIYILYNSLKSNRKVMYTVMLVIFAGLMVFSAYPKYKVETSMWPPGQFWTTYDEIGGYQWMKSNLPAGTSVFNLCKHEGKVLGFDMYHPPLEQDIRQFREKMGERQIDTVVKGIDIITEEYDFEYVVIDVTCSRTFGNRTNNLLETVAARQGYEPVHVVPNNFFLFRVA